MFDPKAPADSDDWWALRLAKGLGDDLKRLSILATYRDGCPAFADEYSVPEEMRDSWRAFLRKSRLNMAELVITALTGRLIPKGFKTAAPGDDAGDSVAMNIWRSSHMGVQMRDLLDDFRTFGRAALFNDQGNPPESPAPMVALSPREYFTEPDPWRPWNTLAAIRIGWDPIVGADKLWLYRKGYVRSATNGTKATVSGIPAATAKNQNWSASASTWDWDGDPVQIRWLKPGQCPITDFRTRVGISELSPTPVPLGDFETHIDDLERINHTILQRLTLVAMQAFRQRALKGDLPQTYPADHPLAGQQVNYNEIFKAGPAALWMLPNGAEIWESTPTDITPILGAIKEDIKNLAAVTSTPLYALSPDAQQGSAEGAALSREMLLIRAEDAQERADGPLRTAMSLAFQAMGDQVRADPAQLETIWAPLDRSSLIEQATAASAMKAAGAPFRLIMEKALQLSPPEIAQAQQDQTDDLFNQALAGVNATTTSTGGSAQQ